MEEPTIYDGILFGSVFDCVLCASAVSCCTKTQIHDRNSYHTNAL